MSYDAGMEVDTGGEHPVPVGEWHNYTYNVYEMYRLAFGCDEGIRSLHGLTGEEAAPRILAALEYFAEHYTALHALNPENGWGNVAGARRFLDRLLSSAHDHPKATVGIR